MKNHHAGNEGLTSTWERKRFCELSPNAPWQECDSTNVVILQMFLAGDHTSIYHKLIIINGFIHLSQLKCFFYVYGDNMSVINKVSKPETTLKKKSYSICYHAMHEAVAMGEVLVVHIPTKKNCADFLTKVLYGQAHRFHVKRMLLDVFHGRHVSQQLPG